MTRPLLLFIVEDSKDCSDPLLHAVHSAGYEPGYDVARSFPAGRSARPHQILDVIPFGGSVTQMSASAALALAANSRRNSPPKHQAI